MYNRPVTAATFEKFIRDILLPALNILPVVERVLIVDNARIHYGRVCTLLASFCPVMCVSSRPGATPHPACGLQCREAQLSQKSVCFTFLLQELPRVVEGQHLAVKYLPPYSPQLNPTELVFADLKNKIRSKRPEQGNVTIPLNIL